MGDRFVDVRVAAGAVAEVVDSSTSTAGKGSSELEAAGGWIVPGIHDHHIHLRALVAARASVSVGPPHVTNTGQLRSALAGAPGAGSAGWIRGVGYHESVAGELDRYALDRLVADRPLRVQHRSGILWVLNSLALDVVGAESDLAPGIERDASGRPTGRFWRMDEWLSARTAWLGDSALLTGLGELSREAAALGVTGWTDATPGRSDGETALLQRAVNQGLVRQRLHLMTRPGSIPEHAPPAVAGRADRFATDPADLVTTGAVKVLLDDFDLPPLDELVDLIRRSHVDGRPVAFHCVTRTQLVLVLAALDEAGGPIAGDRIEHGSVIPAEVMHRLHRSSRLTVVTQPNFVFERGDEYLRSVEPDELGNLWRAASLVAAGVSVAAGTDAPFGGNNPWDAIRTATTRRTVSGALVGQEERVDAATAFSWFCGSGREAGTARRVGPGQPADLVILGEPLERAAMAAGGRAPVLATVVAGDVVFP